MRKPVLKKSVDAALRRRLDALELLIDQEYSGSAKVFEDRTGIKMAQVNQWFSGYRALRENALRRLEKATGKPEGYFDGADRQPAARVAAWPFQSIPIERFMALPEKQQGWIEGRLDGLIENCEAQVIEADEAILRRRTVQKDREADNGNTGLP